ncbi:MAG: enoyl-CoA hydratase-related protein [Pseudomonadales bacterium]
MSQPLVLIDKQDGICRVTLNRPEALNALSSSLRNTLADILSDLSRDTETQVVILTGAGRAFTVGLDLKELGGELADSDVRQASRSATRSRDLGQALKDLPQPGNFLDAETACEWGLVNRVVAPDQPLSVAESLARDIATTEPATRREILRIMDEGWNTSLAEGMEIEKSANIAHSKREVQSAATMSITLPRVSRRACKSGPMGCTRNVVTPAA